MDKIEECEQSFSIQAIQVCRLHIAHCARSVTTGKCVYLCKNAYASNLIWAVFLHKFFFVETFYKTLLFEYGTRKVMDFNIFHSTNTMPI